MLLKDDHFRVCLLSFPLSRSSQMTGDELSRVSLPLFHFEMLVPSQDMLYALSSFETFISPDTRLFLLAN